MSNFSNKLQGITNFSTFHWAVGLRLLFILLTLYTILITAWVGDDIQISFRQIWNFINGDGITFNYGQRVQAFTHPLWFFVLSAVSFVTGELFLTTVLTCVVFSMLAVLILLKIEYSVFKDKLPVVSPAYVLIFSWAFVDYTTSGLENSLSYFLTGLLLYLLFRQQLEKDVRWIYLIMALLVLNRFDYAVLFLPLALILIPKTKNFKGFVGAVWPGVLLIALWLLFATFYFGSPMPNTYYAKLNADYPLAEVLDRGKRYFLALRNDHVSTLIMCSGLIVSLVSRNRIVIPLAIGQIAYMIYIYQIGGDFMQGRFFALPVFLSIGQILIVLALKSQWSENLTFKLMLIFIAMAISLGLFLGYPLLSGVIDQSRKPVSKIFDERSFYYKPFGLFSPVRDSWPSIMDQSDTQSTEYKISPGIGAMSLNDTSYHLIDTCGLADPFLARIPAIRTKNWRIGHHMRKMPQEYGEYLIGAVEKLPDTKLNHLLIDVNLASRENLFSSGRFGAIWRLNTNYYKNSIDFSQYQDLEKFIPSTLKIENIEVTDLENFVELEDLPEVYPYEFRRFNNNVRFELSIPETADGLNIRIDVWHIYDLYVNDEKVQRIEIREDSGYYRELDTHIIRFDEPKLVKSVLLKSVGASYPDYPAYNHLTLLKLIQDNK